MCTLDKIVKQQSNVIAVLQTQLDSLNDKIGEDMKEQNQLFNGKKYSTTVRLLVYDIVNQVQTGNITTILKKFSMSLGHEMKVVPQQIVRWMGVIVQLQTAEEIICSENST